MGVAPLEVETRGIARAAWAAGAITLLVCLALIYRTESSSYWTGDCASRALLAERLLATGYTDHQLQHPAPALDPEGEAFPLPHLTMRTPSGFTSIFPLGYAALAAPLRPVGGPAALRWPAALGSGACAALFALWVGAAFGGRRAAAAGVCLGVATPLLFYGAVVWEHSLCVALCLAASVLAMRATRGRLVLAGASAGLAVWLREEVVLFVPALALACAWGARRAGPAVAVLIGAVPALALLAAWNSLVYGIPLGPHTAALDPGGALTLSLGDLPRRIGGLVVGFGPGGTQTAAITAALALAAAGAAAAAEWRGHRLAAVALAGGGGLCAWGFAFARSLDLPPLVGLVSYNGWIAQLPAAGLAGVGGVRLWRDAHAAPLRPGVAAGLLFLLVASAAGLVTQPVFGTGVHVGPRLLLPALPALAALAVAALCGAAEGPARRAAAAVAALVVAAGAASSARSAWLLVGQNDEIATLERVVRTRPERVAVSGDAMLTQLLVAHWSEKPLLYTRTALHLRRLVQRLAPGEAFLVVAPERTPMPAELVCERVARHRGGAIGYVDTDLLRCHSRLPREAQPPPPGLRERSDRASG